MTFIVKWNHLQCIPRKKGTKAVAGTVLFERYHTLLVPICTFEGVICTQIQRCNF